MVDKEVYNGVYFGHLELYESERATLVDSYRKPSVSGQLVEIAIRIANGVAIRELIYNDISMTFSPE